MEMALRASKEAESQQREFLETLLRNARVCVAVMEGDELRYTLVNRAYQELRPELPMIGRTVAEVFPEAAAIGVDDHLRRVLRTGEGEEAFGYHAPVRGKPDARWDHQIVVLPEVKGRNRSVLLITWDSTAHYRARDALRESEQRLQIAKEAAGFGVYVYDIASGHISWDERIRSIWGASTEEPITYERFMDGLHPDDRGPTQAAIDCALDPRLNGNYRAEYRVINPCNRRTYWVYATGFTEFSDGKPARMVGAVQDITSEKEAKTALMDSQAHLQEADRQKDEFLAMLGHELRSPLSAIRTASEFLRLQVGDNPQIGKTQDVATLERTVAHLIARDTRSDSAPPQA